MVIFLENYPYDQLALVKNRDYQWVPEEIAVANTDSVMMSV
jgi:hypothetical protein